MGFSGFWVLGLAPKPLPLNSAFYYRFDTQHLPSSSMERVTRSLRRTLVQLLHHQRHGLSSAQLATSNICTQNPLFRSRRSYSYVSEMRQSAFEGNILRLLRNEIQYELEHAPPKQVCSFPVLPFL